VPPPLDPQLRADILRDIQDTATADPAQKLSRNEIARRRGVSQATVTKIAKDAGLTGCVRSVADDKRDAREAV
jgi:DNA-binding transcriptional regulator LsrR (DeoR family)